MKKNYTKRKIKKIYLSGKESPRLLRRFFLTQKTKTYIKQIKTYIKKYFFLSLNYNKMTKNTLTTNLEAKKNKKKSVKKEVNKQFTNKNIDKILQEKMKTLALAVQIFNSDQIYDRSEIFKKYIENSGISISSIKYSPNKKYIALCLYTCISWGSPRIYYDYDYPYDEESMIYLINIDNLQYIPKMYCKTH
ncbi:MAG: hypothetical protein WCL02_01120 [bacterium]